MAKPQQPELARSRRGSVDASAVKEQLTAPMQGGGAENGDLGPIPEDQLPGHHPPVEQDKPSGEAFLQKLHEHAADVPAEPDVQGEPEPEEQPSSDLADRAADLAAKPFEAVAGVIEKVRDKLPD